MTETHDFLICGSTVITTAIRKKNGYIFVIDGKRYFFETKTSEIYRELTPLEQERLKFFS